MSSVGFGVTVIVTSGPAVTVIVAETVTPLHVTDTVEVPTVAPAVNSPVWVIEPAPEVTDHVGVTARTFPFAAFATAVNCCVPFTGMLAEVGEMVSDVVVRTSVELLHAAVNTPANATATTTRAMRAR